MDNNVNLTTKFVGEITGKFFIASYQRGYRWRESEVARLLDDVYNNGKKSYCLQPIVVRKRGENYELIDGQQRFTTIYLIYKYLHSINPFFNEPKFTITYELRNQSEDFLGTLDFSKQEKYIDFWFMANAYKAIQRWFEENLQMRAMHMFEYFKEDVKIIWYEVGENADPISLFTRLNIGKIPLTSAELVKAMFLSRGNYANMDKQKQEEIALQWDNIEKELHNNSFWYFLTNNIQNKYQTRIDLVMDLITSKQETNKEKYYSFYEIDKMRQYQSLEDIWRKIQQTFLILKDWYEDHELYHKIGYLIASEDKTIHEIFEISQNKKKNEFKDSLNQAIKESIKISSNYADLSYTNANDYKKINKLLLLFNIESVRRNGENTQWFPFDKFKFNNGEKVNWSLEHIHAQHSAGMRTQEVWKEWLRLHVASVKAVCAEKTDLLKEMEEAMQKIKLEGSEFEQIQQKVTQVLSATSNTDYIHSIANLALLDSNDNAALNNSTFDVKRNKIIEMDKKGEYIPFCTKMVFLKYYSESEDNQLHFWGDADRVAYVNAINNILKTYLEEPIDMEKED